MLIKFSFQLQECSPYPELQWYDCLSLLVLGWLPPLATGCPRRRGKVLEKEEMTFLVGFLKFLAEINLWFAKHFWAYYALLKLLNEWNIYI